MTDKKTETYVEAIEVMKLIIKPLGKYSCPYFLILSRLSSWIHLENNGFRIWINMFGAICFNAFGISKWMFWYNKSKSIRTNERLSWKIGWRWYSILVLLIDKLYNTYSVFDSLQNVPLNEEPINSIDNVPFICLVMLGMRGRNY